MPAHPYVARAPQGRDQGRPGRQTELAPPNAYIGIHDFVPTKQKKPLPSSTGRRLTVNAGYEYANNQPERHADDPGRRAWAR